MPRREAVAAGLATWALALGVARADNKEQAARLAAAAEALGKKQQFADALSKYKEAARLDPATAAYQCNIGMAYYALGDEARAHLYFGRCYRQNGGWPESVEAVFNYVVGVLGKEDFTPLKISGSPANAEVTITLYAEEGPLVAPVTVYVPFSNYEIQVRADGYQARSIPVEANARSEKAITYELEPAPDGGEAGGSDPAGPGPGDSSLVGSGGQVEQQVDSGGGKKKWPLVLAGGGAVAAIGGIFAYKAAKDRHDTLWSSTYVENGMIRPEKREAADELEAEMKRRQAIAFSLWGIGAAAIGTGVILYFMQPESDGSGQVSVSAAPTAGGGMVSLSLSR